MTLREFMHELRRCAPRYTWNVAAGMIRGVGAKGSPVVCPITAVVEFRLGVALPTVRAGVYAQEKLGMTEHAAKTIIDAADRNAVRADYVFVSRRLRRRILTMVRLHKDL